MIAVQIRPRALHRGGADAAALLGFQAAWDKGEAGTAFPVIHDPFQEIIQGMQFQGLDEIGADTQLKCTSDMIGLRTRCQHEDGGLGQERRDRPDPFQDLEPRAAGHVDIEQDERGDPCVDGKERHCLLAVGARANVRPWNARSPQASLQEQPVVTVVIDDERTAIGVFVLRHRGLAFYRNRGVAE